MELPKRYDPKEAEPRWQKFWEDKQIFVASPEETRIRIDTPPPTMSGKMHIGHAFSYTQQDLYARYWRMRHGKVFYPFGTDDNGLATERMVEKIKGVRSTQMTRKEFRDLCNKTVDELRGEFVADWQRIGVSADYQNAYSTISEPCQAVSQRSFIDLFRKGRVYRQESPVAWCVTCQTAIAQAEFENIEQESTFNDVIFKADGTDLVISTTRPELIPACVCLAAHPEDERYKGLVGRHARVPLSEHEVPIIADESVDQEKGSGLMMVCTFGDKEDVEKWHKHSLPLRMVFTRDGKLNDLAGAYSGLKIKEARTRILEDLGKRGLLKNQKKITHAVNVHERCGTEVEFLKTWQWYIRVLDIKEDLLEAGRRIIWHPEFMKKRYEHWVENLNWDWCISRQRYFGIPFPVWRDRKSGEVIVAEYDQLPVDPFVDKPAHIPEDRWADLEPEEDVMDTWATSSVTPQITLDWHNNPDDIDRMLPMTLRPQAHDIIRTWAFYTIVKALLNNNTIPWENVAVSGFVLDPRGEKMSKSKGNVIMPKEVIEKYSADTVRFWAAGAKLGDDLPYLEKDLVTGHKTVNKLWNASKFAIMNLEGYSGDVPDEIMPTDLWILSKYARLVGEVTANFDAYEHSKAKFALEQFFWNDFCDNYLELVKGRLYEPKQESHKASAQHAIAVVLGGVLKMFAPIMPFITEEIHSYFPRGEEQSIHVSKWPEPDNSPDDTIEKRGEALVKVIQEVRKHKSTNQMSMRAELEKIVVPEDVRAFETDLRTVTRAAEIVYEEGSFATRIE